MTHFKKKKFNRNDNFNAKPKELGSFIHFCEDLVIVKVSNCDYIPFPNALVLNKDHKVIGKVEEVLGPQNEVYVAIKREIKEDYDLKSLFYCYENKFIPKERFMERSEVEKKKEEGDKDRNKGIKGNGDRKGRDRSKGDFNKRDFKGRDVKGKDKRGFNKGKGIRSFGDRKKQWNKN
jgi:H/ACA ribonucleoprotein complex subunit 1